MVLQGDPRHNGFAQGWVPFGGEGWQTNQWTQSSWKPWSYYVSSVRMSVLELAAPNQHLGLGVAFHFQAVMQN